LEAALITRLFEGDMITDGMTHFMPLIGQPGEVQAPEDGHALAAHSLLFLFVDQIAFHFHFNDYLKYVIE
jgi:hypothetical protein